MKRFYGMVAITVFATIVAPAFAANKVEPGFQGIGGKFGEVYECAFPNTVEVDGDFGDFAWRFAGWHFVDNKPIQSKCRSAGQLPATTELSDAISKDLKKRDFNFVGSTIIYAFMQATGMVNDHITSCFRHRECADLA